MYMQRKHCAPCTLHICSLLSLIVVILLLTLFPRVSFSIPLDVTMIILPILDKGKK